jgi:hypothetical protein
MGKKYQLAAKIIADISSYDTKPFLAEGIKRDFDVLASDRIACLGLQGICSAKHLYLDVPVYNADISEAFQHLLYRAIHVFKGFYA